MGNFNQRGNKFGGKKSFGGGGGFGGGGFRDNDRGERPAMFKATCAECGKQCEVPFKPNGSKPVYCSDCFGKKSGSDRPHSDRPRFDSKPSFRPAAQVDHYRKDFESLNTKLDDILRLLSPKASKPIVEKEKIEKKAVVKKVAAKKVVAKKKPSSAKATAGKK